MNWPERWAYSASTPPVAARNGMVACTDRYASEVGVGILKTGGNAVDAAVAVSLTLAVVNPEAGNIGGGGYMVVRMADGTVAAQDHRTTAPAGATRDMYLDAQGNVTEQCMIGHLSSAVPGTVRGLWDAHHRFGSRDWEDLVEPAIQLARGFAVGQRLLRSYTPEVLEGLRRFPESARIYLPNGEPPKEGDRLSQPDLARTLERIRDKGPSGFYAGETADRIVEEMQRGGGLITHADLEGYRAIWREPVRARYRGHTIVSMPPSSSGGVTLAESAQILERFPLQEFRWHEPRHIHLMAEAWRRAYADRNRYLADPGFVEMPTDMLTSPEYAAWRARDIVLEAATPSAQVAPGVERYRKEGKHTTHVSIVDQKRNAVALTTTINSWYGGKVVAGGTGVLLNNDMDDFTAKVGVANQFGLVQGEANVIAPNKRMLSAMSPTVVLDPRGKLAMVIGTPGGSTIITTVFQVISNVLDYGMNVAQAVLAPRVHHQHLPDQIFYENKGLGPDVVSALEAMGHKVEERKGLSGDCEAIRVLPDGSLEGIGDPRRGSTAVAF